MSVMHINGRFWLEAVHDFIRQYDVLLPNEPELRTRKLVYANGYHIDFVCVGGVVEARLTVTELLLLENTPVCAATCSPVVLNWIEKTMLACGYVRQDSPHICYQHPDASGVVLVTPQQEA